jgi:hypothetical protein
MPPLRHRPLLAFATGLDIEDQQKHSGHRYKQDACNKTKIINLHSCLVRKSSLKINSFHHIRGRIACAAGMRNASDFVTILGRVPSSRRCQPCAALLLGLGDDADGSIDDALAGEAIVVRFVFETFDFDRGAGFEILQSFDDFDDAGAALAVAAAVHHLAHHGVEIDAVFHRLDAQVGPAGGHNFLAFIDKFDVGASDEFGCLLRVHRILKSGCRKLKGEWRLGRSDGGELTRYPRIDPPLLTHLNASWPRRAAPTPMKIAENPTGKSPARSGLSRSDQPHCPSNITDCQANCNKFFTLGRMRAMRLQMASKTGYTSLYSDEIEALG